MFLDTNICKVFRHNICKVVGHKFAKVGGHKFAKNDGYKYVKNCGHKYAKVCEQNHTKFWWTPLGPTLIQSNQARANMQKSCKAYAFGHLG